MRKYLKIGMIPPQNKNNLSFRKVENFIIYHPWAKPKLKYMINHTFIRLNTKYPVNLFYLKESCRENPQQCRLRSDLRLSRATRVHGSPNSTFSCSVLCGTGSPPVVHTLQNECQFPTLESQLNRSFCDVWSHFCAA